MTDFRNSQIAILKSVNSLQEERIQSLFQLMNIADKESLDAIYECLKNDSCQIVRHEAAFVLGETAAHDAIDMLKWAIDNDRSVIVIHEALLALGTINNSDTINFIKSKLDDPRNLVAESAKIALQRIQIENEPYRGPKQFEDLK